MVLLVTWKHLLCALSNFKEDFFSIKWRLLFIPDLDLVLRVLQIKYKKTIMLLFPQAVQKQMKYMWLKILQIRPVQTFWDLANTNVSSCWGKKCNSSKVMWFLKRWLLFQVEVIEVWFNTAEIVSCARLISFARLHLPYGIWREHVLAFSFQAHQKMFFCQNNTV